MTKISNLNTKLIVPNDYQQFWVHFEWFLSLSNFGCKIAIVKAFLKTIYLLFMSKDLFISKIFIYCLYQKIFILIF